MFARRSRGIKKEPESLFGDGSDIDEEEQVEWEHEGEFEWDDGIEVEDEEDDIEEDDSDPVVEPTRKELHPYLTGECR